MNTNWATFLQNEVVRPLLSFHTQSVATYIPSWNGKPVHNKPVHNKPIQQANPQHFFMFHDHLFESIFTFSSRERLSELGVLHKPTAHWPAVLQPRPLGQEFNALTK